MDQENKPQLSLESLENQHSLGRSDKRAPMPESGARVVSIMNTANVMHEDMTPATAQREDEDADKPMLEQKSGDEQEKEPESHKGPSKTNERDEDEQERQEF